MPEQKRGETDGEVDALQWVSLDELHSMIVSGELQDSISLAAFTLWKTHNEA